MGTIKKGLAALRSFARTKIGRGLISMFVVLGVIGGSTVAITGVAEASASGCTYYGSGLRGPIRNGQYCSGVNGSGTYINFVPTGSFGASVPFVNNLCNPSQRLAVYDRWGRLVATRQGGQLTGCSWGTWNSVPGIGVYWSFPAAAYGFVLVTLQDSGRDVATVKFGLGG